MAKTDTKLEHLANVRLFEACNKKELRAIGRASDEIQVAAGKNLVEEGTTGHEFFLIVEGQAVVRRAGRKVATLGPGQYFGELSLLDGGVRSASVTAETPMTVLVLGRREFNGILHEVPELARKLLTVMAGRLRESDARAVSH